MVISATGKKLGWVYKGVGKGAVFSFIQGGLIEKELFVQSH